MRRLWLTLGILLTWVGAASAATTCQLNYQLNNASAKPITPPTRANVQAILDMASPSVQVFIQQTAGILEVDSTLWFHGNTQWKGHGQGISTIKRTRFSASDPADAGHVVVSAKPGTHTPNKGLSGGLPADSLANIILEGVTIDGNYAAWPLVDPSIPGNFGIQFWFVDGVTLRDVEIKNTLQTGIEMDACKNVVMESIRTRKTGQHVNISSRNGINLNNNSGSVSAYAAGWGKGASLTDIAIIDQRDAAIDLSSVSDIAINNVLISCPNDSIANQGPPQAVKLGFEIEGNYPGIEMRNIAISNVVAKGLNGWFLTKGGSGGQPLRGLKLSNVISVAADSGWGGGIALGSSAGGVIDADISNCTFSNLNARNVDGTCAPFCTASGMYLFADDAPTDSVRDIRVQNVTFRFAHGETFHSANPGVRIGGNAINVKLDNVKVYNAEGPGFLITADDGFLAKDITLRGCEVDGAQREGFTLNQNGVTGDLTGVNLIDCKAVDTNKNTPGYAFLVNGATGTDAIRNVKIVRPTALRTSGSNMLGIRVQQSGTAVVDSVWVLDYDTYRTGSAYTTSGSPTNLYARDVYAGAPQNNQFDNNVKLQWKNTGGTYVPVAWLDSLNTVRLQSQTGGNIDLYRSDGVLGARFSGGDWNVTNGGGYILGGFQLIRDSGNERRIINRGSGAASKVSIRDDTNTLNLFQVDDTGDGYISSSFNVSDTLTVAGPTRIGLKNFATLGTPTNGFMYFCTDCQPTNPTAAGGVGTLVRRENGQWNGGVTFANPFSQPTVVATDSARVGTSGTPRTLTVSGGVNSYGDNHMNFGALWMNFSGGSDQIALKRDNASTLALQVPVAGSSGSVAVKDNSGGSYVAAFADNGVWVFPKPIAFASLPASVNGCIAYCFDCQQTNPTAASGPGAIVRRENGQWNGGATGSSVVTSVQTVDLSASANQTFVISTTAPLVGRPVLVGSNPFNPSIVYYATTTAVNQVTVNAVRLCGTSISAFSCTLTLEIR